MEKIENGTKVENSSNKYRFTIAVLLELDWDTTRFCTVRYMYMYSQGIVEQ